MCVFGGVFPESIIQLLIKNVYKDRIRLSLQAKKRSGADRGEKLEKSPKERIQSARKDKRPRVRILPR